jgi:hypothetical protein
MIAAVLISQACVSTPGLNTGPTIDVVLPVAHCRRVVCGVLLQMCQVYDSAECCRNVHAEPAWQQAASTACQVGRPEGAATCGCSLVPCLPETMDMVRG